MPSLHLLAIFGLLSLLFITPAEQNYPPVTTFETEKVCGLNFVAPPKPFSADPMPEVKSVGANWIAVIPYAFTRPGEPRVHYNQHRWQWWGERPEGAEQTIRYAKEHDLNVMLKPQVYVPGSWPGGIDFQSESDWLAWERDYENYIMPFAEMAQGEGVKLFCIGTEFKISSSTRASFWRQLIGKVRECYDGKIVYAANWDEYQQVSFWDALDYIGIDAYFPLSDSQTPDPKELKKAWTPIQKELKAFHQKWNRSILFTEFGYLSVDQCASRNWELEDRIRELPVNEKAQANAIHALFDVFWKEPYWQGGFLWKWFPHMHGHEGYPERDYTPQGKMAESILRDWYGQ